MNAHIRNCCTWQRLALTALLMFTGTSQAAGLLTPSDGRFPELEIRDHAVDVVIEDGLNQEMWEQLMDLKNVRRGRIRELVDGRPRLAAIDRMAGREEADQRLTDPFDEERRRLRREASIGFA